MKIKTMTTAVLLGITSGLPLSAQEAQSTELVFTNPTHTTDPETFKQLKWDTNQAGREIDLSKYNKTFNDDFKVWNIVADDVAPGPNAVWFAPGHGAYKKNSPFRGKDEGPFKLVEDGLQMRVEKVGNQWLGACMTTVNMKGQGWSQQYGYFEATIKFDYEGPAIWGAFWAKSHKDYYTNGTATRTEIDFVEFYGDPSYHASLHLWGAKKPQPGETILVKNIHTSGHKNGIAPELYQPMLDEGDGYVRGFHTYGGEITPEWVIMYFDRKEVARFPTMEEWKTPLYMLLDIVLHKREEADAKLPYDMIVKNVSAYLPNEPYSEQEE